MQYDLFGRIAGAFASNKPLSSLIVVGVIVFGSLAFLLTPKQYNPQIDRPAFLITVNYPGASVQEVEDNITFELVEKIRDLPGIDEVHSQSIDGGSARITAIFDVGEELDTAKIRLYSQIEQNIHYVDGTIEQPVIQAIDPDDIAILSITFTSKSLSQNEIRSKVISLSNHLKTLPGVANLEVYGGEPPALVVELDPKRMREHSVTAGDVVQALQASNNNFQTNDLKDKTERTRLIVDGTLKNSTEASRVIVRPGVRLSDVSSVYQGYAEKTGFVLLHVKGDGVSESVYLAIAKRKGTNAPTVSSEAQTKLSALLATEEFSMLEQTIVRDDGRIAKEAIGGLSKNLLTSIIIVGAILLLFLSARPALIVMTAIPMTLLLVFAAGYLFDQTINRITLFALILSLGLLVDSATVVTENIYRHLKMKTPGISKRDRVMRGVSEVGTGLVLSVITSIVVFLPMNYITGMMGPYMGPISFFVPMALLLSLIVAFVTTPFIAYHVLSSDDTGSRFTHIFDNLARKYATQLAQILKSPASKKRLLLGFLVTLVLVLTFPVVKLVHFKMLPPADKEQFYIYVDMPVGTDTPQTLGLAEHIIDVTSAQLPEYRSAQIFVASKPILDFNGMFKGAQYRIEPHQATIKINLTHPNSRRVSSMDLASQARTLLDPIGPIYPDTDIQIVEDPPGPPVQATIVAKIFGPDETVRVGLSQSIAHTLENIDGVTDISTSIDEAQKQVRITVDTDKALTHGITPLNVGQTLRIVTGSQSVSQYHNDDFVEYSSIRVSYPHELRDNSSDLALVDLRSASGDMIPLTSITSEISSRQPQVRHSEDLQPVTFVTAEVTGRSVVYAVIDTIRSLLSSNIDNFTIEDWDLYGLDLITHSGDQYRLQWGGEWEMTLDNFRDLGIAMLVAFFAVYMILVAQYRSFLTPGLIMMTVPFGLVGILPGFAVLDALNDTYLTATALIGFIALIGIVVNNAIIYLEYFTELRKTMSTNEALVEAGRVRMRPILLTSLTTILGSLTIAFDPVWSGLAWSIVFGLSLSAVMTLLIFPILYSLFTKE